MVSKYGAFVLGGWALLALSSALAQPEVYSYQLANGLKLLVKPDHRAAVVVSQVWYKVGSSYEQDGTTGLSHALEHMMFKGTPNYPAGEFSRRVAEMGGSENAFTSQDYTAYYQRVEKRHLQACLTLEADRMRHLLLEGGEFAKEIKVIQEERRLRTEDKPEALAYEHFLATAFLNHPYRIPVIGWMNDLQAMQIEDLKAWYATWYAPNNATVVVVGDVEPEAVLTLVTEQFGALPPSPLPRSKPVQEATQLGEKRLTVNVPAQLSYLLLGYKVPALTHAADEEVYALAVLAGILDGGDSARLAKNLVRGQQLAASASAGYEIYERLSSLFLLTGIPAKGVTPAQLEQAILAEIRALQTEGVQADELARVKAQVVASAVYQQDSLFYQAMEMGILETIGVGWQRLQEYPDKIRAVTAAQVQAVAQKYLIPQRLTVGVLNPLPMTAAQSAAPALSVGGLHHDH